MLQEQERGELTFTTSNGIRFSHSNQTDSNDGRIGAGHHSTGLNIVGLQTSSGTGRQVRIWGDVITDGGHKYWNANNDGSASGLDADLLDGQHGSYYRAYANLTGTPTIPSLSGYATESYVGTQISNLVDSSPAALNTLNELAAALGDNENFATDTATAIGLKATLSWWYNDWCSYNQQH